MPEILVLIHCNRFLMIEIIINEKSYYDQKDLDP